MQLLSCCCASFARSRRPRSQTASRFEPRRQQAHETSSNVAQRSVASPLRGSIQRCDHLSAASSQQRGTVVSNTAARTAGWLRGSPVTAHDAEAESEHGCGVGRDSDMCACACVLCRPYQRLCSRASRSVRARLIERELLLRVTHSHAPLLISADELFPSSAADAGERRICASARWWGDWSCCCNLSATAASAAQRRRWNPAAASCYCSICNSCASTTADCDASTSFLLSATDGCGTGWNHCGCCGCCGCFWRWRCCCSESSPRSPQSNRSCR